MAIDKAVDSQQLDGALSASADAIRAKTGNAEPIPFDAATGFASAISAIATGGGTLAIKTGTVTLAESYLRLNVAHGCGKLPLAFFLVLGKEFYQKASSHYVGGVWLRGEYGVTLTCSTSSYISGASHSHVIGLDENPDPYSLYVDEETAKINPAQKWFSATYNWIAIYEV